MTSIARYFGIAALLVSTGAAANVVPRLSSDALRARADIAAIVRVTGVFTGHLPDSSERLGCWNATVMTAQKGAGDRDLVLCLSSMAEKNPRPPEIGLPYQIYLIRSPSGAFFPITQDSWVAVER